MASLVALLANCGFPKNATIAALSYSKLEYPPWFEALFGVWERSDALWYSHIARDGYIAGSEDAVFMPFYPLFIRAVHELTWLPYLICGLLVSNIALIVALIFFRKLVQMEYGPDVAERASWYLMLFPGSFFFLAPYTESVFLCLAICVFYYARQGQWKWATLTGFLLSLTRNSGFLIVLPMVFELHRQRKNYFLLLPMALGPFLVSAQLMLAGSGPMDWVSKQSQWGRHFSWPWQTYLQGLQQSLQYMNQLYGAVYIFEFLAVTFSLVVLWLMVKNKKQREPWTSPYLIFSGALVFLPLWSPYPGRVLMSDVRFTAVIFPLFLFLARLVQTETMDRAIRLIFTGLYALALALYVCNQNMF